MKQQITFNSVYSSTSFDGQFEVDEWMEKVEEKRVGSDGLTVTYTTSEPISQELQKSVSDFKGVASTSFNK